MVASANLAWSHGSSWLPCSDRQPIWCLLESLQIDVDPGHCLRGLGPQNGRADPAIGLPMCGRSPRNLAEEGHVSLSFLSLSNRLRAFRATRLGAARGYKACLFPRSLRHIRDFACADGNLWSSGIGRCWGSLVKSVFDSVSFERR